MKTIKQKIFKEKTASCLYFDIQSVGSSMPTTYSQNAFSIKKYGIYKQDIFTSPLWQKADSFFVSNKDEESAKKFKQKYKLI